LDYVLKSIRNLNRDDKEYISIWADIITGFAGETDEDFKITCDWLKKYRITKLHAFPFSDHHKAEKIPASLLPNQIPQEIRKERNRKLIEIGDEVRDLFIVENYWRRANVLIEEVKNWKSKWWTDNYLQILLDKEYKSWELVEVEVNENNCIF
jgi:threonylcarbamoyladenosine tRNA methylthiotransferase MtaB